MSKIGKLPIAVPGGVKVEIKGREIHVSGKLGSLKQPIDPAVDVVHEEAARRIVVTRKSDSKRHKALHGLTRALLSNMVSGVSAGFTKKLEIIGTGYNAKLIGRDVTLQIGFCHPVVLPIPEGLDVKVPNPTRIEISGADKQIVGQYAANIRRVRPPEVYKGKGIKYENEVIRRKAGKALGDKK